MCNESDLVTRDKIEKAGVSEIEAQIIRFTGSSGGGQWSFQLECKLCRDLGTVSAKKHSIGKDRELKNAAKKFYSQGWWTDGKQLICPKCYRRHYT